MRPDLELELEIHDEIIYLLDNQALLFILVVNQTNQTTKFNPTNVLLKLTSEFLHGIHSHWIFSLVGQSELGNTGERLRKCRPKGIFRIFYIERRHPGMEFRWLADCNIGPPTKHTFWVAGILNRLIYIERQN